MSKRGSKGIVGRGWSADKECVRVNMDNTHTNTHKLGAGEKSWRTHPHQHCVFQMTPHLTVNVNFNFNAAHPKD